MSISITQFGQITQFVASSCWAGSIAEGHTISGPDALALLGAWNAAIKLGGADALDLQEAAARTWDTCSTRWTLGDANLQAACSDYGTRVLALFPDQNEPARPIANWATLIVGLASTF